MAELRWIMTSSLVMLQVLSCTVTSVKTSSFTVRDEDEVTFPCESEIHDQKKCNSTAWLFSTSGSTVTLFEHGKFKEGANNRLDRLSVTEECSLVIKKVKDQDVGRYICRQFESGEGSPVGEDVYHLSVVDGAFVTKTTNKPPVNETPEKKTTKSPPEDQKPVTAGAFVTKTTNKPPVNETPEKKTTKSPPEDQKPVTAALLRTFVVCLGSAALLISVVTVNIWTRTKGKETRMEEIMQLDEVVEGDDSVNYVNVGEPSASVSLD
uniref:uncharacterized protein LOC120808285 isoform X1 n=1 Tax=Gasterosteus aculeatus aculeatus TaxID=481459 RepID=UPI001A9834FB|nr:uncharacterized protein LOC120808285 isoform X1 [Gasterosteus aculeatus aculeatus]